MNRINEFLLNENGQGMVEYALIIALVALLLVGALNLLKNAIEGSFEDERLNQVLTAPDTVDA